MLATLQTLRDDREATIFVEFALSLPILMALSFTAIETANLAVTTMRVGQITMTVADNLSRAKQDVPLNLPQLREIDINDQILGAVIQAGDMPLLENGRIVLSSLQVDSSNRQTIRWQRCKGKLRNAQSKYGTQGSTQNVTPGFSGMGSPVVRAPQGNAIVFAEVTYKYEPMVGNWLLGERIIRREAAFFVRDERDLDQVYNPSPGATVAACNVYNDTF